MVFLQFALSRLLHGRQRDQAATAILAPDMLLSLQELSEQLLELGYVKLFYRMSELKLTLTLHCQTCGLHCREDTELVDHLHAQHPVRMALRAHLLPLLR